MGDSGTVLYDRDDLAGAAEKFKRALKIAQSLDKNEKEWTGWWYYNLASVSIDLGKFDDAESNNKEALSRKQAIGNRADFYPRVNEAHIAAGRKDPQAEALYRGLIAEYREGMNPVPILEAQAGLAGVLADKGEFEQADAQFRATLAYLESQRTALAKVDNRMTYFARLIRFYDRYINFLVDRGQPERALEVAESSRARVLDERLQSKPTHALVGAARMREMARASGSVFLSYWLGKNRSFLWAVTAAGITLHHLPGESQITPLLAGYRSFIENLRDPLKSEYPAGPKLAEMLLGPVRPLLASAERIVLVPDRSLNSLNFETLPDPDNPSKYFIERATLELAPSLDILADPRPPASSGGSLLLIGDPVQAVRGVSAPSLRGERDRTDLENAAAVKTKGARRRRRLSGRLPRRAAGAIFLDPFRGPCRRQSGQSPGFGADPVASRLGLSAIGARRDECSVERHLGHALGLPQRGRQNVLRRGTSRPLLGIFARRSPIGGGRIVGRHRPLHRGADGGFLPAVVAKGPARRGPAARKTIAAA